MENEYELRTWTVVDSRGRRHEVQAHYVLVPSATAGFVTFCRRDVYNNNVASFWQPRAVTPKENRK